MDDRVSLNDKDNADFIEGSHSSRDKRQLLQHGLEMQKINDSSLGGGGNLEDASAVNSRSPLD